MRTRPCVGGAVLTLCGVVAGLALVQSRPAPAGAADDGAGKIVLEVRGWIVPGKQVQVVPDVGGRVTELPIEEGKRVCRGEVLARLDDRVLQLDYKQAQARLEQARALRAGPRKEERDAARAGVAIAEAACAKARLLLDAAVVRAPFDGTVLVKKVEVGGVVQPLGFNVPAAVCELADLSELEVDLWVQERDIALVAPGQRARIRLEAHPDRKYEGKVSRVLPVADRARGAVGVRVRFKLPANEEPGKYVRPEMGAVVSLLQKE
jgi:HlyD family secretion protein